MRREDSSYANAHSPFATRSNLRQLSGNASAAALFLGNALSQPPINFTKYFAPLPLMRFNGLSALLGKRAVL